MFLNVCPIKSGAQNKISETVERTQNQANPFGRQEISLQKATVITDPLYTVWFQRMWYATYSLPYFNPQKVLVLTFMGPQS